MPDIRSAHAALATLLESLSITAPYAATIKKAWKFTPPQSVAVNDYPAALMGFEQQPVVFHPGLLHKDYAIHVQLLVGKVDAQADEHADAAAAFMEAVVQKLSDNQTISGTVSVIRALRGETPETLTVLEWGGSFFVGLDFYVDIRLTEAASHAA